MAKKSNSFRIKKTSNVPLVFNYEIELNDAVDDPDVEVPEYDGVEGRDEEPELVKSERNTDPFDKAGPPDDDADTPGDTPDDADGQVKQPEQEKPTSFTIRDKVYPFSEEFPDPEDEDITVRRYWFRARPKVPGIIMLDLAGSGVHENGSYQAAALREFLDKAIDKRDRKRFEAMLTDEDNPVDIEDLGPVIDYLTAAYADRPTERPAR